MVADDVMACEISSFPYPGEVSNEDGALAIRFSGVDAQEAVRESSSVGCLVRIDACLDHLGLLLSIEAC